MKHQVDARLVEEAVRHALRFACEDCAHWAARSRACTHGYPRGPAREALAESSGEIEFCKEFELGASSPGRTAPTGANGARDDA